MPDILPSQKPGAYPLLATRFFLTPLPLTSILRSRLIERLGQGLQVPLTLVCAPPGFGKSSLIRQWIHDQPGLNAGWLSLEASDQDWGLFFRYLVAAWQRIFPQVGEAALAEWNASPSICRETLIDLLLNDIVASQERSASDHALLVLDDYHRIESTEVHSAITYLVEHLPPRCHLALLTRADPPLPLPRWRSHSRVLEVRADDLRFTSPEAVEFFNQSMHLELTRQQVEVLQERTEGWIVGLQMAALALQGLLSLGGQKDINAFVASFCGCNRFVVDYLLDEVVRQQPDEIQQFLLKTALFDQFCGPLCDELFGTPAPHSQRMIERLEKANLFLISLDEHRYWFRYHHLFADLLRAHLQQTYPDEIPELYRHAAEWFARNHAWRDSIRYALQTKDMDYSANLFEQAILKGGLDFLYSGMRSLIEQFPAPMVQNRPLLSLAKAVAILESSQLEGIEPLLRFVEEGVRSSPPFPGQEDLMGWIYLIQVDAAIQLGNHSWAVQAGQWIPKRISRDFVTEAEGLVQLGLTAYYEGNLNQTEIYWQQGLDLSLASNNTYYTLAMLNCLARLCYQKGEPIRSEAFFQRAFKLLEEYPGQYLIWLGAMQRDYSDLLRDCNRLGEARTLIISAIPLLEKWHTINALGYGFYSAGRIQLALGDPPGAHEWLNKIDDLRRRYTLYPDLETLAMVTRARVYLEEGETGQAWQILENCLNSHCCQYVYNREWALIVQARILIWTDRPAEALALLAGWLESAKAGGRGRNWLSICLLLALARHALGDIQEAYHLLGEGLLFAKAQGHRRALIEEGEPMRVILKAYQVQSPRSPLAGYIPEVLSLFPALPVSKSETSIPVADLYESLTPREFEILRLVCQGLSNQEIARQLVLSVGTVKSHIHNTFGKLGVRDRPQAIAKAGLLGFGNWVG